MPQQPTRIVAVGAGDRTTKYARYALRHPDRLRVVAVADPDPIRRDRFAAEHGIPPALRFDSYEALARQPKLADAAINGTLDRMHYASSVALLRAGYHLLLEKPIAPTEHEVRDLIRIAETERRVVMICHVLRYTPFYSTIKQTLMEGRLGRVVALRTEEAVGYLLLSAAFLRGKWNDAQRTTPILLAKCCHDLDLIAWLMSGNTPVRVASFGALTQFRPDRAPRGAGTRCVVDCEIEPTCAYSARRLYLTHPRFEQYAWDSIEHIPSPTRDDKLESLRGERNPHGRCAWKAGGNQFDHQSLIVEFADGATATHDLFGATARKTRTIRIVGTEGELEGDFENGRITIRLPDPDEASGYREQVINVGVRGSGPEDGHGGGDARLIDDFVRVMRGEPASHATTRIEDSLVGHLMVFAANRAVTERRVVDIDLGEAVPSARGASAIGAGNIADGK